MLELLSRRFTILQVPRTMPSWRLWRLSWASWLWKPCCVLPYAEASCIPILSPSPRATAGGGGGVHYGGGALTGISSSIQDVDLEEALEPDMEEDDDQKAVKDEL